MRCCCVTFLISSLLIFSLAIAEEKRSSSDLLDALSAEELRMVLEDLQTQEVRLKLELENLRQTDNKFGPQSALDFYKKYAKKPIPMGDLTNIKPLTKNFWKPEDILRDLQQTKKICAVVVVKTELCAGNVPGGTRSRICAVTTAALEKRTTPLVGQCQVYMAWIKNNQEENEQGKWQKTTEGQRWEVAVANTYKFQQGPGSRLIFLAPGVSEVPSNNPIFNSDGARLKLNDIDFRQNNGYTPDLETFLRRALARVKSP